MTKYEDEDFRTPDEFFNGVQDLVGKFDLDVCASIENTKCENFYNRRDNGLIRFWNANNIWCNPPYSNPKKWFEKAIRELDENRCKKVVFLIHLDTSTKYFHEYILERASEIYFVKGRLHFEGPHTNGPSPRPSVVVVLTRNGFRNPKKVFAGMNKKGQIIRPQTSLLEFGDLV